MLSLKLRNLRNLNWKIFNSKNTIHGILLVLMKKYQSQDDYTIHVWDVVQKVVQKSCYQTKMLHYLSVGLLVISFYRCFIIKRYNFGVSKESSFNRNDSNAESNRNTEAKGKHVFILIQITFASHINSI